jgi:hypothetical protein
MFSYCSIAFEITSESYGDVRIEIVDTKKCGFVGSDVL